MRLLHKLGLHKKDLKTIYILYFLSHLEQLYPVWHSSLTPENITDMERVQKTALNIIFQKKYCRYGNALKVLSLEILFDRRESLCLSFTKKCTRSNNMQISKMFPLKKIKEKMNTRKTEEYNVNMAENRQIQELCNSIYI